MVGQRFDTGDKGILIYSAKTTKTKTQILLPYEIIDT